MKRLTEGFFSCASLCTSDKSSIVFHRYIHIVLSMSLLKLFSFDLLRCLRFRMRLDMLIRNVKQFVQQKATWFALLLQNYNIINMSRSIRGQAAMVWLSRSGSSRSLFNIFQYENIWSLRERVVCVNIINVMLIVQFDKTRHAWESNSKAKRPAWPHRPVCGTLSQNGYGEVF